MQRFRFGGRLVSGAGYDPLYGVLEIEFTADGQVWQYEEVPEDVWYLFRTAPCPDRFFGEFIRAYYPEKRIT